MENLSLNEILATHARVRKALDLVDLHGVQPVLDYQGNRTEIWAVASRDPATGQTRGIYLVQEKGHEFRCSCPDTLHALGGWCKHAIASAITQQRSKAKDSAPKP